MKNLIFIFLFLALFSATSFAQKLSYGIEAGLLSSDQNNAFFSPLEFRRNSFNIGLNLNYHLSESISFTTGLHYLRQGFNRRTCFGLDPYGVVDVVGKFDYLMVPLSVNFHLLKSKRLTVQLGINAAYNINATMDYPEPSEACYLSTFQRDQSSVTRNFNLNATFGIGYKIIKKENSDLSIMLKHSSGLNSLSSTSSFFSKDRPKNNSFSANLIYNFKPRKSKTKK